jgi:TonB family protein
MSMTVTELTQGNLQLSSRPAGAPGPSPEAWRRLIGKKPVSARLDTLPETKPRLSALLTSTIFQVAVAAFLVAIPMFFPDKLATKIAYEVMPIAAPQTEVQLPPKPPVVHAKILPTPPPIEEPPQPVRVAKLIAPKPLAAPKPKPAEVPDVKPPELPKVNQALTEAKFEAPPEPARPREPVKTGNLATGSAAPATISKPIDQVQTGGFGDTKGLPGPSNPNRAPNIGHFGSPALPAGPGYGNGTGGANGARGTVASSGFGNGVAIAPTQSDSGNRGSVKSGGFETAAANAEAPKQKQADSGSAVQAVTILDKPKPQYSDEARKLGIEGDVLVEVMFPASGGPVQVIRVTKGLGHGLDEAAMRAAQQIRFKPALQDGKPVDFPATVHIEFQLAF